MTTRFYTNTKPRSSASRRFLAIMTALSVCVVSFVGVYSETAEARKFTGSRLSVHIWCGSDGAEYGSNGTGEYGCDNDNGWVHCNANDECEGGRHSRTVRNNKPSKLPPARNSGSRRNSTPDVVTTKPGYRVPTPTLPTSRN